MIKKNFLTGDYVIFSPERVKRPQLIAEKEIIDLANNCPFCLANKNMIQDRYLYEAFNNEIRVIQNKYPIVKEQKDFFGIHQVIVDTKEHNKRLHNFSDEHIFYLMKTIKDCMENFYNDKRLRYVQFFKNQGYIAGASQPHSHWQILGVPVLPRKQEKIVQTFKQYELKMKSCYLCDLNLDNLKIEENDYFISFCPEDSIYFYEINIIPKNHILSIKYLNDEQLKQLAKILKNSIKRLNYIFKNLDYNICLFNCLREEDEHHFFFQIVPRLGNFGGYEISTGMFVNSILPYEASKNLKNAHIL